jgi:putative membrane protein
MIVRKHLALDKIVYYLWKPMSIVTSITIVVSVGYTSFGCKQLAIPILPIGILGTALAILLGFRNNSAYDRWWEGRRLWGAFVNDSRSFARQVLTFLTLKNHKNGTETELKALQKELVYRQIAFIYAAAHHLRKQTPSESLKPFLSAEELASLHTQQNVPNAILQNQAKRLQEIQESGYVEDFRHMQMDTKLSALCDSLGGCERIKNTIFPRQYSYYTNVFVWVFLLFLPFSLVQDLGYLNIPATFTISFIFFVLMRVGSNIENPFENSINDTPMSALSRTIEINLRQQLGETELPPPIQAIDGYLY